MKIFLLCMPFLSLFGAIQMDPVQSIFRIEEAEYLPLGFGTARMKGRNCTKAVKEAIEKGYGIIDTASVYGNFDAVGKGIRQAGRSKVYLISKVWHDRLSAREVERDLDTTLRQLGVDCLDAYLIHWPNSEVPIEETLGTMEKLKGLGKIRHIGLSNVSANHVKRALETGIGIDWVQIEMSPQFYDAELLELCQKNRIAVQAWAPLGVGSVSEDPLLLKIGKKLGKTPAQMALRWIVQHGCLPLPKSENPKHIAENRAIFDFQLSKEDMEEIDQRAKLGQRTRFSKEGMGFSDEYDFSYEQCWPQSGTGTKN